MRAHGHTRISRGNQRNVVNIAQVRLQVPNHEPAALIACSGPNLDAVRQDIVGRIWRQFVRHERKALNLLPAPMVHIQ